MHRNNAFVAGAALHFVLSQKPGEKTHETSANHVRATQVFPGNFIIRLTCPADEFDKKMNMYP